MMWGRIKANDLGQPVGIFLSAHARRVLGSKPYVLETAPDGKTLILRDDRGGLPRQGGAPGAHGQSPGS